MGSGRERVRCSSLVDWPVYPRLVHSMRASTRRGKHRRGGMGRRAG